MKSNYPTTHPKATSWAQDPPRPLQRLCASHRALWRVLCSCLPTTLVACLDTMTEGCMRHEMRPSTTPQSHLKPSAWTHKSQQFASLQISPHATKHTSTSLGGLDSAILSFRVGTGNGIMQVFGEFLERRSSADAKAIPECRNPNHALYRAGVPLACAFVQAMGRLHTIFEVVEYTHCKAMHGRRLSQGNKRALHRLAASTGSHGVCVSPDPSSAVSWSSCSGSGQYMYRQAGKSQGVAAVRAQHVGTYLE